MSDIKCAPYPWMQDKYGNVKDANGDTVKLTGFALSCGYTPKDDSCYVNTQMAIAAPELLEALDELVKSIQNRYVPSEIEERAINIIAKAKGQ